MTSYLVQVYARRRKFLEDHKKLNYDVRCDSPHRVYIPKEWGKPLLQAIKEEWQRQRCDWAKFARYAEKLNMSRSSQQRQQKSDYKSWLTTWFGKDWFFYLWIAFGEMTADMMVCVNDICRKRANYSEDVDKDPASSQVDASKLSERNYAQYKHFDHIPEVKGIQHKKSLPKVAREYAKWYEARFWVWVRCHPESFWPHETWLHYHTEKGMVEEHWQHAHLISEASGYEFKDREGKWRNKGCRPKFVEQVTALYIRAFPDRYKILRPLYPY